jgi:hypothetical protein
MPQAIVDIVDISIGNQTQAHWSLVLLFIEQPITGQQFGVKLHPILFPIHVSFLRERIGYCLVHV